MAVASKTNPDRLSAICSLLAIVVFVVDLSIPLGVAGGVPYMAVIVLTARIPGQRSTTFFAIAASVLVVVGLVLSPAGGDLWQLIANRAIALSVIWIAAVYVANNERATKALVDSQGDLAMAQRVGRLGSWARDLDTGKVR